VTPWVATSIFDIKPKIEPKEEASINVSSRDIKNEPIEIISDDTLFIVPDNSVKKETSEPEFQKGLAVIEEMDETIFNKKPKTEPFDIKPKIEPKEELGNKDVSNNIEDDPFEIISDNSFSHTPNEKDVEVRQKVGKGLKRKRTSQDLPDDIQGEIPEENFDINKSAKEIPQKRKRIFKNKNQDEFICNYCEALSFSKKVDLKKHVDAVHKNLKLHKCEYCDKSFTRKGDLKKHVDAVHKNLKPNKCEICDTSFSHKGHLKRHVDAVHKNLKPHKCEICDKSFSLKKDLKQHVDGVHKNLKSHKCEICEFSFSRISYLKTHVDGVHKNLKPHKCEYCDLSFSQKGNLKKHVDDVHKNLKSHKCEICELSFSQKVV